MWNIIIIISTLMMSFKIRHFSICHADIWENSRSIRVFLIFPLCFPETGHLVLIREVPSGNPEESDILVSEYRASHLKAQESLRNGAYKVLLIVPDCTLHCRIVLFCNYTVLYQTLHKQMRKLMSSLESSFQWLPFPIKCTLIKFVFFFC